jgi:hypothetical protein
LKQENYTDADIIILAQKIFEFHFLYGSNKEQITKQARMSLEAAEVWFEEGVKWLEERTKKQGVPQSEAKRPRPNNSGVF